MCEKKMSMFFESGLAFAAYTIGNEPINNSFRQCTGSICDLELCDVTSMEGFEHLIVKTSSLCKEYNYSSGIISIIFFVIFIVSLTMNIIVILCVFKKR